jgi:hypothetical protein
MPTNEPTKAMPPVSDVVMSKILPSVKAQAEKVNFDFDATAPISEQVAAVLDGVAQGKLASDVARLIIESIKSLAVDFD